MIKTLEFFAVDDVIHLHSRQGSYTVKQVIEPDKLVLWTKLMMHEKRQFVVNIADYKCHAGGQMRSDGYHKKGFRVPLEKHTDEEVEELMKRLREYHADNKDYDTFVQMYGEKQEPEDIVGEGPDYDKQEREWEEEMRRIQLHDEEVEEWKRHNESMVKEITEAAEYAARKYYMDDASVNARKRAFEHCTLPTSSNKRFICGWVYSKEEEEKEFVMVFWDNFSGIPNGHSDLQQLYEVNGARLQSISGGFFITENHNDYASKTVYLFGKSQTYSGFERDIPEILKYGEKHGITFVCRPEMKGLADLM